MTRCTPDMVHVVCEGLDHPECLAFDGDGAIVAGGEAGQIYRKRGEAAEAEMIANTGGLILGVATDARGSIYACDCKRNLVFRIDPGGGVSTFGTAIPDCPIVIPNYGAFDRHGNYFFSASGTYFHPNGDGKLFVISPDGVTRCIHPGPLRFANSVAIDWENDILYVVESTGPAVLVFALDGPAIRSLTPMREHRLAAETVPDGLALDTDRNLFVSYYKPDQIGVIRTSGAHELLFIDPTGELLNRPTNIALRQDAIYFANFGGWNLGSLDYRLEPLEPFRPNL